jgi:hypothetical protein
MKLLLLASLLFSAPLALLGAAAPPASGAAPATTAAAPGTGTGPSDGGATDAGAPATTCVEHLPTGAERPVLTDRFPSRGLSGYAATLEVKVFHGKGETVLPNGLAIRAESEAGQTLKKAGFVLPNQDGGARARVEQQPEDPTHPGLTVTMLSLPVVVLPSEPGRNTLTLPPLPVAVARKNGDLATVCTHSHIITVEDPIANTPDPFPQPNPRPEPQREEWTALKDALKWIGAGVLVGVALLLLLRWWNARPKPVPPPPPPRPAWEVALEKLALVREENLLEQDRRGEHFDRVSDAVRAYLGDRYGFDGMESTTDEMLAALKKRAVSVTAFSEVTAFLSECDLVKFAKLEPTPEQCEKILEFGISIVRSTTPSMASMIAARGRPPAPREKRKDDGLPEPGGDA